jgi:hypothetical protein
VNLRAKAGHTYQIPFPFHIVDQWVGYDEPPSEGWKPGAWLEEGDLEAGISRGWTFDDWGTMVVEVLEMHRITGFHERCFFVVSWISPEGRRMGKRTLQCRPTGIVTRMLKGSHRIPQPDGFEVKVFKTEVGAS